MYNNYDLKSTTDALIKQAELSILDQLNDLIKRDLLRIVQSHRLIVQEPDGTLSLKTSVKLELRDQDYIKKLEEENRRLKDLVDRTKSLLQDLNNINSPTT